MPTAIMLTAHSGEVPEQCIDNIEWNHIDRASPRWMRWSDRMDGWHYATLGRHTTASVLHKHPDKDTFVFSYFRHAGHVLLRFDDSQQKVNFS